MKNKKAQILSIFLSACMLGTSAPVSAADLSSELFSADDITDTEAPADASQDQPAADDEVSAPDSTDTPEEPSCVKVMTQLFYYFPEYPFFFVDSSNAFISSSNLNTISTLFFP